MSICYPLVIPFNNFQFLTDDFPGPVVLLATTKENSNYSGPAVRVRRVSDDAEQDIVFVGKSVDVVAFNSFIGGSTGRIRTWYDQSGNANHGQQTTNARQPRAVVVNGAFCIENDDGLGLEIAYSASHAVPRIHCFAAIGHYRPYVLPSLYEVIVAYTPPVVDSANLDARWGMGFTHYDFPFVMLMRNGAGFFYDNLYNAGFYHIRGQTDDFVIWDYSSQDKQLRIGQLGWVFQAGAGDTVITYPTNQPIMIGNGRNYDESWYGRLKAVVVYPATQDSTTRNAISAYLHSAAGMDLEDLPPISGFSYDGYTWTRKIEPTFQYDPPDVNNMAWHFHITGADWSMWRADTAGSLPLWRMTVHPDDLVYSGGVGGERSEESGYLDVGGVETVINQGDTFDFFVEFMFEPGDAQDGSWAFIFQWHYGVSSVPDLITASILEDELIVISQSDISVGVASTPMPFTRGVKYGVRVNGFWSLDGTTDRMRVWAGPIDAPLTQLLNVTTGNCFSQDDTSAYFKNGIYRGNEGQHRNIISGQFAHYRVSKTETAYAALVTSPPAWPSPA